jgi:hypothetical protein
MKTVLWNPEKALILRADPARHGVGFEECLVAIEEGRVLADIPNPSPQFQHQRMFVLNINDYAYVVPYLESDEGIFLKTVFPSRKHTAKYLRE